VPYKHGTQGNIGDSKAASAAQASTVAVYVGTAPINLVRGYADAGLINNPVRVSNMPDAQVRLGYSTDWDAYTLCEAFAAHFDNTVGNVGPIHIINVLDPDVHKEALPTTDTVTFSAGRGELKSDTVIIDTFVIADKVEGVDFKMEYNYTKGALVITSLKSDAQLTGEVSVSFSEIDKTKVVAADIIGGATSDGEYTGLASLSKLYQNSNAVTNIIAAPGWGETPSVYTAMVSASQKINGHWDAFVITDIPIMDGVTAVDTITKAKAWKVEKGYTSERSKVCWPMGMDGNGRIFHLSTIAVATMLRTDNSHDSIPMESPSNKQIAITKQYFGADSKNQGYDQQTGNQLNETGITTAVYWGGKFVLWGPHTAAFMYGGDVDPRAIFDVSMRMLMHITNSFQLEWGTTIDEPMSTQLKDTIVNREQEKLDTLGGMNALIGNPVVEFLETANPLTNLVNGDFVWNVSATPTPPLKSASAIVSYTDEGFAAYFGGE